MVLEGTFEKRCLTTVAPVELSFITTAVSIIATLTSIPGNILIILAVVLDLNKNLRAPFNWLIVNLAMADLIVGTMTAPLSVYVHMKEGLGKKVTPADIKAIHMTYFISCTASVLSVSTLAVERYLAVRKPNTYRTSVTNKRVILTIVGVWLISLSLPNIYFKVGSTTYAFIFANASVALAITITCLAYTLMLQNVKERSQHMVNNNSNVTAVSYTISSSRRRNEPCQNQSLSTAPTNTNTCNSLATSTRQMETKVTKMFTVVLIAMLCCYGPSTIAIYIMNFCELCSCTTLHWFRDLQFLFVIMNSSVNFYCYALQSPRFRSAFVKILRIKRRDIQTDESRFSNVDMIPTVSFSAGAGEEREVQRESTMTNEGITNN